MSHCLEFGGTEGNERTRDKFWYRAMLSDSPRDEGLLIKVARRPRTRRGEQPHPTLRLMRENPVGMLYAKIKSGQVLVENHVDFVNRMTLMRLDEEAKAEGRKGPLPSDVLLQQEAAKRK